MHMLKLHLPEEPHTYISVPVEGITRRILTNKCMPHVHSQTMATCKTKKSWNEESLVKALKDLEENKLSLRAAAGQYGIPRSTLHDYAIGKSKVGSTSGPDTVLTREEEEELVEWALKMADIGYGQTRRQICEAVKRILDHTKRSNPFTENRPGKDWWYGFLRRHPKVAMRQPQALQASRASACTAEVLDKWFHEFEQFLLQHDLLDKPNCIWNCDESGFPLCPKSGKVLAPQGARNVYHITGNNKQQITTLCCISAAGGVIPPMHVYPGERFGYNPLEGGVEGAYFGKSQNGWMTQELFHGWISKHYPNHLPPGRPVCLLVDGHSSHIDLDTSKFCAANQLLLYCLPPHTSHVLQPLDVGFFGPLKRAWQDAVAQHQLDEGKVIDKRSFARVFHSAYKNVVRLSTIVNAYRASGIYPVDRHAINPKKLEPARVFSSEPSSSKEASSCPFKPGPGASKLALKALEEELDEGTICLFNRRYEEGYDVTDDALYTAWAKLKRATQPLADISNTRGKSHTSNSAPSHASTSTHSLPPCSSGRLLEDVLKIPERQQAKTTTRGTARLPKHLSSEEMVKFLEERKMQKIREAQEKEERKAAREAKKKQREEEKQQKAAKKASQKRQKQKSASGSRVTDQQQKVSHTSDSTVCPVCDGIYEEEGEDSSVWVECIGCEEWFHLHCTIPPGELPTQCVLNYNFVSVSLC